MALAELFPAAMLMAVEPNAYGRQRIASKLPACVVSDALVEALPLESACADLVLTCGCLCHVSRDTVPLAVRELGRVAGRYVLMMEYFYKRQIIEPLGGADESLVSQDWGAVFWKEHPAASCIGDGWFWSQRDGLTSLNWWLFDMRGGHGAFVERVNR